MIEDVHQRSAAVKGEISAVQGVALCEHPVGIGRAEILVEFIAVLDVHPV